MTLRSGLIIFAQLLTISSLPAQAPAPRKIWVVQESGAAVEYDALSLTPRRAMTIPASLTRATGQLMVNKAGQILGTPGSNEASAAGKIWFWNTGAFSWLDRGVRSARSPAGPGRVLVEEADPRCVLSADGESLYWYENEFRKLQEVEGGELSVTTTFRVWHTGLSGGDHTPVAESVFDPCSCGTGACSETCPEADFWVPSRGLDDFFIVTYWIPGQLGPTYQSSFLYRKSAGTWSSVRLPQVMEEPLDAPPQASMFIYAEQDSACCGWDNESDDRVLALRNGQITVLFDERARYGNPDYDVNFSCSNAALSPSSGMVAMTISSSARPGAEMRLSSGGRPNAEELERIRRAVEHLPAVEVVGLENPPERLVFLPHASLVGWLGDNEILVIEEDLLAAVNIATGERRKTQIPVSKGTRIFLR